MTVPSPPPPSKAPQVRLTGKRIFVVVVGVGILSGVLGTLAVYYLSMQRSGERIPPSVLFGLTQQDGRGAFLLFIVHVWRSQPLGDYAVQLLNVSADPLAVFPDPVAVVAGRLGEGHGVVLSFEDRAETGTLSEGDAFVFEGVAPETSFALVLLRTADGQYVNTANIP